MSRVPGIVTALITLLSPCGIAHAQARDTGLVRRPAAAVDPDSVPSCCSIVRIDSARSRVIARELATGFTFTFEVRSRRTLRALRVGRPVWADFAGRTVRLNARDREPCCTIVAPESP